MALVGNLTQQTTGGITNIQGMLQGLNKSYLFPKSTRGISGWEFDLPNGEELHLSATASKSFVESGAFHDDHVVNEPIDVTLSGFIGEKIYKRTADFFGVTNVLKARLNDVSAFVGPQNAGAIQKATKTISSVQAKVNQINQQLDAAKNMVSFVGGVLSGTGVKTKQQLAFEKLFALWQSKQLCSVLTPWMYFENYLIVDVSVKQNGETDQFSDIVVKLQEYRFTALSYTRFNPTLFDNPNLAQAQKTTNTGQIRGAVDNNNTALLNATNGAYSMTEALTKLGQ